MSETFIHVAIAVPVHHPFTYRVPESLRAQCRPGSRVRVPFGTRERLGIVLAVDVEPPRGTACKDILGVCDPTPVLPPPLLALCTWISQYYAAPIGEACRAALPSPFLRKGRFPGASRLSPVHQSDHDFHPTQPIVLTAAQQQAIDTVGAALRTDTLQTYLLHGVTGSGKTEVYLELIAQTIASGKTAILLLPEIGLTPQLLSRVAARFGEVVAVYHSGLTDSQRIEQWHRMAQGIATICCGTRSALFAPLARVGCIILDEEHDASYKQEESPRYHARDAAVMRAKFEHAVVVLGSATPSLETFHNVQQKKYHYLSLPDRPNGILMPSITLVDMRKEPPSNDQSGLLSAALRQAIAETLARGEQSLLFLNRRGFASMLLCRACGHVYRCPNCDISLTVHRRAATLRCHYCEFALPRPTQCTQCASDFLKTMGSGTERIEGAIAEHFPTARLARLDSDTVKRRGVRSTMVRAMRRGEIDILIGTQMITKGHDFPGVTLVGVVQADLSLYLPDFRAAERTFQLLTQVAGRAGRSDRPGYVIIQTYTPEHYSLLCAQQHCYADFITAETAHRQDLGYPPFGRLINVRLSGNVDTKVSQYAEQLRANLDRALRGGHTPSGILGPSPSPMGKISGRHRWQLLIKSSGTQQSRHITAAIRTHADANAPSGVTVAIDVDPLHLL